MFRTRTVVLAVVLAICSVEARADVRIAKVFTDHMVLQQEMPVAVWGQAEPHTTVTVTIDDASAKAKANQRGQWRVDLPAMKADGKAHTLGVTAGGEKIERNDVLLGEVWI